MRRRKIATLLFACSLIVTSGFALSAGCDATKKPNSTTGGGAAGAGGGGGMGGSTGGQPSSSSAGGDGGDGNSIIIDDGGNDVNMDVTANPCGTKCGDTELCDPDHVGLDDNCNGQVDEGCPCSAGQAHSCFKGDPSYAASPGCFPGTEKCTENGEWGPCVGGVHATDDQKCYLNNMAQCHPISAVPFQDVHLKDGTGMFSQNAVPGSEVWEVTCPQGVDPCPGVNGANPPDNFKPLQSGEYSVKYTKGQAGGGTASCTYPLFVGAPGLRVELEWEHDLGDTGVDLDLHVHQPNNVLPWSVTGDPQDCTWSSCTIDQFQFGANAPSWFNGAAPPDPVNWYLDPVKEKNTCYFAPRGKGQEWQMLGMGCHNPRLDLDNIYCDPTVVDVNDDSFCAPENINIDYPPKNQWIRIGVHYFGNHDLDYDVHPSVKVYCNGALAAQLGPAGFYTPEAPITFVPSDGNGVGGNRFWLVADVAFVDSKCGNKSCVVEPLYADPTHKTPVFTIDKAVENGFGPDYPPLPQQP
jgi:hypothetical protein